MSVLFLVNTRESDTLPAVHIAAVGGARSALT